MSDAWYLAMLIRDVLPVCRRTHAELQRHDCAECRAREALAALEAAASSGEAMSPTRRYDRSKP